MFLVQSYSYFRYFLPNLQSFCHSIFTADYLLLHQLFFFTFDILSWFKICGNVLDRSVLPHWNSFLLFDIVSLLTNAFGAPMFQCHYPISKMILLQACKIPFHFGCQFFRCRKSPSTRKLFNLGKV